MLQYILKTGVVPEFFVVRMKDLGEKRAKVLAKILKSIPKR